MYRNFRAGIKNETKLSHSSSTGAEEKPEPKADPEVEERVTKVWNAVAKLCRGSLTHSQTVHRAENAPSKFGGWQTVRIFVSSTFIDFFSEREVLVKKVFPELREWCQERRVRLVECDLRWGVPKDATSTQALLTCLEEIDRCYQDNQRPFFLNMLGERSVEGWGGRGGGGGLLALLTCLEEIDRCYHDNQRPFFLNMLGGKVCRGLGEGEGGGGRGGWLLALLTCLEEIDHCYHDNQRPFFLNMLGERYGWIPWQEEIPQEVRDRYHWVDDSSMTFMELLHGALRISNPNAAFFMRDPGFNSQLPDSHVGRFQGENALAKEHMKVLKGYLKHHFPRQVFPYTAQFGGVSDTTGRDLVNLTGLDRFAEQVKEFFQTAIEREYPQDNNTKDLSPEDNERELQWLFIKDKADSLTGRDAELQQLLNYSHGEPDDGLEKTGRAEDWEVKEGDCRLCLVTAHSGWGKTALLAGLVSQAKKEGQEVMYHFVGSTANSRSHAALLRRLLLALTLDPAGCGQADSETDTAALRTELSKLLSAWRETERQILIVIDGVNELDNSGSVHHLSWLPPALPPGVRCVVSANETHLPTTARLFEHPAFNLSLQPLDSTDLCQLAARFFLQYGKKLESGQLGQLVDSTKVDNPLWMVLMCEELRVFGDFRMMDRKLQALPDTMEGFLATVISRLVTEDETGYVKKTLYLTASSTTGLPTEHILQLLGDVESKTGCPPLYWAQARRILKPYSRTLQSAADTTEYFTFVHEAMWKAVRQCMDSAQENRQVWHKQLADFYQYACDDKVLRINHLPRQLQMAGCNARLVEFVRRDQHASYLPGFQRSQLLRDQRCRNPSDTVLGTKELVLCQGCGIRTGGFNRGVHFPNRDVCYLCSSLVFRMSGRNLTPARICSFHAMRSRMGPNIHSCCVCGFTVVVDNQKKTGSTSLIGPLPALLCQHCGFGINGKVCCMFKDHLL
ncbi:hypothetical protein ACOMHN_007899 [Nucella lapillus]